MFKKLLFVTPLFFVVLLIPSLVEAYTVQPGDTLSEIASGHGLSLQEIIELNPQIENPDLIYVGEHIDINDHGQNDEGKESEGRVKQASAAFTLTEDEKDLFARVVHAEAKGESYEGKVAVAQVILNRVEDHRFPDSITEVIKQPGQFQPVADGSILQSAGEESVRAVEEALQNRNKHNTGAVFFYNPDISTSSWIFTTKTIAVIGNHVFSK